MDLGPGSRPADKEGARGPVGGRGGTVAHPDLTHRRLALPYACAQAARSGALPAADGAQRARRTSDTLMPVPIADDGTHVDPQRNDGRTGLRALLLLDGRSPAPRVERARSRAWFTQGDPGKAWMSDTRKERSS